MSDFASSAVQIEREAGKILAFSSRGTVEGEADVDGRKISGLKDFNVCRALLLSGKIVIDGKTIN